MPPAPPAASPAADEAAAAAAEKLRAAGLRADLDLRNEKINLKIRELAIAKVPYVAVIGDREADDNTVVVRARDGSNKADIDILFQA